MSLNFFLPILSTFRFVSSYFHKAPTANFTDIRPLGAALIQTDRRTDKTRLLVAFTDHAISPANTSRTPCRCKPLLLAHCYYWQITTSRNQTVALILPAIRNMKQERSRALEYSLWGVRGVVVQPLQDCIWQKHADKWKQSHTTCCVAHGLHVVRVATCDAASPFLPISLGHTVLYNHPDNGYSTMTFPASWL